MKTKTFRLTSIALAVMLQGVYANAQDSQSAHHEDAVRTELLHLRADLLQFLLTTQQGTIQTLKRELDQVHRQQRQLQEADADRRQQLVDIEQQLSNGDLEPDTRPQFEAIRQQLSGEAAEKLETERSTLRQREADLTARVAAESQRQEGLQRRAEHVQEALDR